MNDVRALDPDPTGKISKPIATKCSEVGSTGPINSSMSRRDDKLKLIGLYPMFGQLDFQARSV